MDGFLFELRKLQKRSKCSNAMCDDVVEIMNKYFDDNKKLKAFDKSAQREAGVTYMVLDGCPKCEVHVYKETDSSLVCPHVNADGSICGYPRFDDADMNKPFQASACCCSCMR